MMTPAYINSIGIQYHSIMKSRIACQVVNLANTAYKVITVFASGIKQVKTFWKVV